MEQNQHHSLHNSSGQLTEKPNCCLLDDCGRSVNATSSSRVSFSEGGIIGVFMSIMRVSVSEAIVKLDEGIYVDLTVVQQPVQLIVEKEGWARLWYRAKRCAKRQAC